MWTKPYAFYIAARFLGMASNQMLLLVLGLALYDLTGNPFHLGVAGLMMFVPGLTLVFVTGIAADRLDRRLIVTVAYTAIALAAAAFTTLTLRGAVTPATIFALFMVMGVARAFYNPAIKALLVNIVPIEELPRAIPFNTTAAKAAAISGPVIGGLLYALSPVVAFGAAAACLCLAALLALGIGPTTQARLRTRVGFEDLIGGVRTILGNRVLFAAMTLDLVAVILSGATAMLPVYGREILHVGAAEIGLLRAASALGTLVAAAFLVWRPLRRRAGVAMLGAMAAYGGAILVFGLSTAYWLSFAALAASGVFDMVSIYVRESLIQLRTPDEMRGRVNAINLVFNSGANELGDFRAGTLAALIGTVPAVAFGGLCSIAIAAFWAWKYPDLRRMDRP